MAMRYTLLRPGDPTWSTRIARLSQQLPSHSLPHLFPSQFLHAAFPAIGGHVVFAESERGLEQVGFLFPRAIRNNTREYTLRLHTWSSVPPHHQTIEAEIARLLWPERVRIEHYDPTAAHSFQDTHHQVGEFDVGRPGREEASQIQRLHQDIWGGTDLRYLYPTDMHSSDFPAAHSLVARHHEQVAGFLFAFYRFGGPAHLPLNHDHRQSEPPGEEAGGRGAGNDTPELSIEVQTMGVALPFRRRHVGFSLMRFFAERVFQQGITTLHWTTDPLQFPNVAFYFGKLRTISTTFLPDHYPVQNALNRVPASRFVISWHLDSRRVQTVHPLPSPAPSLPPGVVSTRITRLSDWTALTILNDGPDERPGSRGDPNPHHSGGDAIALEIPANWTAMQQQTPDLAARWRATTDQILKHYVGLEEGKYVMTDVAVEGSRRYLIGQRFHQARWDELTLRTRPPEPGGTSDEAGVGG